MSYRKNKQFLMRVCILQTLIFIFISGCKKREDLISLNTGAVLPTDLYLVDTLTILSSTVKEDSIRTKMASNQFLAGKMNDPLFGLSESAIYTQVRLATFSNLIIPETGVDSAFIYLTFTSEIAAYGNLNSQQRFDVYELDAAIEDGKTYYSTDSIVHKPEIIGSFSGSFNLQDSVVVKEDSVTKKVAPGIKIALTKTFAEKLVNASVDDLQSQTNFLNYLKGICIKPAGSPAAGEGAVVGFNLHTPSTKVHVYYDGGKYTHFLIDSLSEKFAQYKISNQPPNITEQKNNPSKTFDTTFVQAMTGAKTHFRIPNLFSLAQEGGIFIHKAELIIPVYKDAINTTYKAPTRLLLTQPNAGSGGNLSIIDYFSPNYGGQYDETLGQYNFSVTRHIQDLFTSYINNGDDFNFGFYLTTTIDLPITPARVLIDSRQNTSGSEKLRLVIMYSKL